MSNHIGDANKMVAAAQEAAGWQVFNSVLGAWQDASKSQYEGRKAHYPEEARELFAAPVAAAPGIDLEQFREAVIFWKDAALRDMQYHNGPMHEQANEADRLLALIDASPKGGSDSPTAAALHAAVGAIFFNDRSDYLPVLWTVVRALSPEIAVLLERDAAAAYDATAPQATSSEVGA